MIDDLKKIAKFVLIAFVVLLVLGVIIGTISYLTSPPSFASSDDSVEIDIGQDGYLKASIKKSLQYKSENIPNGEVNVSGDLIKWKNARNISYVNYLGKKAYVIVWKAPLKDTGFNVVDTSKIAYDYGDIHGKNRMYALYYQEYNPKNKMVYGIILDHNSISYDFKDLIHDILNRSFVKYNDYSYSTSSSGRYHVDDSPYTIARNDPDWYYDHYEYGDNYAIDDYLESQGYD